MNFWFLYGGEDDENIGVVCMGISRIFDTQVAFPFRTIDWIECNVLSVHSEIMWHSLDICMYRHLLLTRLMFAAV